MPRKTEHTLAAVLAFPVAVPAAAQSTLGIRAGLGIARMGFFPGWSVAFAPCPPDTDCPGLPEGWVRGPSFGADIGLQLREDSRIDLRVGAGYARKGGIASGFDAHGDSLPGELSVSYLQLSGLFRARAYEPHSVAVLFGPWIGLRVQCTEEGSVDGSCTDGGMPDVGLALGGGVELALFSGLSLGLDAIYYRGLLFQWGYDMTTEFVSVQAGLVFPVGGGEG